MAVSERDMRELMGLPYIPGTFPTVGVTDRMKAAQVNTSWSEVDQLWDAYYLATVSEGLAPYSKTASGAVKAALLNSMAKRTSIAKGVIAAWLNALVDEVAANGREYYLDPVTSNTASESGAVDVLTHPLDAVKTVAKGVGTAAAEVLKPVADPVTNILKYAAIALVAGAVIYGVYEFTPLFKKARKRKRKAT